MQTQAIVCEYIYGLLRRELEARLVPTPVEFRVVPEIGLIDDSGLVAPERVAEAIRNLCAEGLRGIDIDRIGCKGSQGRKGEAETDEQLAHRLRDSTRYRGAEAPPGEGMSPKPMQTL